MRAKEFIVETAMMGKIADSGKIIRILKKAHTVPFSDEKNWLLVDTDPGKGNSGLGIKWIPADTRFEWVRPYKDTVDENLSPQTIHKLADRKGVKWDNQPSFLQLTKRLTGKEHLDDLDHSGLNKVKRHLDGLQGVAEGSLGTALPWPNVVNKVSGAMKAMGWKGTRKADGTFMFSTRGQETDDQYYIVIIDNAGEGFFTYALGTIEEGDPRIGEQESLPNTEASVSELMNAIRDGFGLSEQGVAEGQGSIVDKCASLAAKYFNSAGLQQQYDIDEFIKINTGDNVVVDKCASLATKYFNSAGLQQQYDIDEYIKANVRQGVAEGQDDKAQAYRAHLIKTLPQIMKLFANIGKGWIPSKEQMLSAVDTAYIVMKHTGDVKQAGKVLMDELNTLYRMSQGKSGVAEGSDRIAVKKQDRLDALENKLKAKGYVRTKDSDGGEYQYRWTRDGAPTYVVNYRFGPNGYEKFWKEQGVAEGQDDKAEAYRAHLIKTLPQIMKLFANIGKGWIPSKEQMLSAVDTAYIVMKHTGDVKQAGKVLMDELNTLYRMSQGKSGVAEGSDRIAVKKQDRLDALENKLKAKGYVRTKDSDGGEYQYRWTRDGAPTYVVNYRFGSNGYEKFWKEQGVAEEMQHKKITELFDVKTAFPLQWDNQFASSGEVHAEAYDADGRTIDISFTPTGYGSGIEIVFKRGGSYDMTGHGDAPRVLATVVNAISQYLQKYQPPYIAFSAKSTGGRAGAYAAMIRRLARGYKLLTPDEYPDDTTGFLDFLGSDKPFILARS